MITDTEFFKILDSYCMDDLIYATKFCRYDLLVCMRFNKWANVWKSEVEQYLWDRDDFEYDN